MNRRRARAAVTGLVAGALLAAGCTAPPRIPVPGLYRLDIRQGNALDDATLARLEPGMERSKVVYLLGTPAVDSVFHPDRWDYLFVFAPRGTAQEVRRITLFFEGDRVARIVGAVEPAAAVAPAPETAKVVRVPPREEGKGFLRRIFRRNEDKP